MPTNVIIMSTIFKFDLNKESQELMSELGHRNILPEVDRYVDVIKMYCDMRWYPQTSNPVAWGFQSHTI